MMSRASSGRSSERTPEAESGPTAMAGRLHRSQRRFDAFADQQRLCKRCKADGAASAGTKHHLSRLNGRLAVAIGREPGPMNRDGARVLSTRDYGDHRRSADTAAMSKGRQKSQRLRYRQRYAPASQVGRDEGPLCLRSFARDPPHCR